MASDCPVERACLLAGINVCVTECNTPNVTLCNGGCCSAATNGTCVSGFFDNQCGIGGGTCQSCSTTEFCLAGVCIPDL
jgi:hypothetical protein